MPKAWTKDEEREQLRKIAALIEETEPGSYIRMAFSGCVKMAEENIDHDFANSYPDMIDFKDRELESLSRSLHDTERELDQIREIASKAVDERDNALVAIKESGKDMAELVGKCNDLEQKLDHQQHRISMLECEIAEYVRGDIVWECRLNPRCRIVVVRGFYGDYCLVGMQWHIKENDASPWSYNCDGWKWGDDVRRCSEVDAKQFAAELLVRERQKECDKNG